MGDKKKDILKYSNPVRVLKNLHKYYGKHVTLYPSTRPDKKYMIQNPQNRWIHFGQMGYEDFTKHLDLQRREAFRRRNHAWKDQSKYTPGHLSFYLLW